MRPPTPLILAARLLAVAIIALFGVVLALPRGGDGVAIAATGLLALALTGLLVAGHLSRRVGTAPAVVTAVGGLAVAGAEMYLHSLPADGADIPLAGVGILFLGVIALVVGAITLGLGSGPQKSSSNPTDPVTPT
ncbi:hypothetical protein [Pimelobacter sp. 30-1]|uniref:hypothetical protein n=1 Tax=Pimelobacter TaxID=2044 RepID=UPI001C058119|nr:hypothetical protein [Pimelobacter sp. 30-1]MBU2695536.1 hypothetical protein [Pimelobacter sp. 30-1]